LKREIKFAEPASRHTQYFNLVRHPTKRTCRAAFSHFSLTVKPSPSQSKLVQAKNQSDDPPEAKTGKFFQINRFCEGAYKIAPSAFRAWFGDVSQILFIAK
jgi:hypothetical protein